MTYSRTTWTDRAVQFPNKYTKSGETTTDVTLVANPGTVTQAGTPINATNLNKIEQGIVDVETLANTKLERKVFSSGAYDFNTRPTGSFLEEIKNNASITFTNHPSPGSTNGGFLIQGEGSHGRWLQQIFFEQGTGKMYYRASADASGVTVWGTWVSPVLKSGDSMTGALTVRVVGGTNPTRPTGTWASVVDNTFDTGANHGLAVATRWGSATSTIFEAASYWNGGAEVYTPVFTVKGDKTIAYNGTTVPQTRNNSGVYEWYDGTTWKAAGGVKSLQKGTTTVSGGGGVNNITIPAVNTAKTSVRITSVIAGGYSNSTANGSVYIELTSSTNIAITNNDTAGATQHTWVVTYEAIEYY